MGANTTPGYELLYDIIRRRSSIRKLKSDPIPEEYIEKILEAGRWAMSGANSQPWEYIVVKDPQVKKDLFRAYTEVNAEFIYWMEQQRVFELRHPAYQLTAEKAVEQQRRGAGWS
ncbi:MAG TPA: nitroreductase family protein, partial [Candidatus Binatia bacterium]